MFSCVTCKQKFARFNNLRKHKRIHKEKPFSCSKCNKRFNNFGAQKKHEEKHIDHRPIMSTILLLQERKKNPGKNYSKEKLGKF